MSDYIYNLYDGLLKAGWRMNDIDEMDILGYLHLRAWAIRKEKEPKKRYIDEIWQQPGKAAVTVR
ncbi:MAG: hypothetical protein II875_02520 [Clostridia bacterium]|nr:hypothetical protein [Clostridia bacterium]